MSSLPTITSLENAIPVLKLWQQKLTSALISPPAPRSPFNFRASGGATGATTITLNWEDVVGADGYQIQMSANGDFSTAPIIATIAHVQGTSWLDNTVTTSAKRWYRIRSTSGSVSQPQSVFSVWSAPISAISGSGTVSYNPIGNNSGAGGWNPPTRGGGGRGGITK